MQILDHAFFSYPIPNHPGSLDDSVTANVTSVTELDDLSEYTVHIFNFTNNLELKETEMRSFSSQLFLSVEASWSLISTLKNF